MKIFIIHLISFQHQRPASSMAATPASATAMAVMASMSMKAHQCQSSMARIGITASRKYFCSEKKMAK